MKTKLYTINFYDSEYSGMRTLLTKTVEKYGTYEDIVKFVEAEKNLWGLKYEVGTEGYNGKATINAKEMTMEEDLEAKEFVVRKNHRELKLKTLRNDLKVIKWKIEYLEKMT